MAYHGQLQTCSFKLVHITDSVSWTIVRVAHALRFMVWTLSSQYTPHPGIWHHSNFLMPWFSITSAQFLADDSKSPSHLAEHTYTGGEHLFDDSWNSSGVSKHLWQLIRSEVTGDADIHSGLFLERVLFSPAIAQNVVGSKKLQEMTPMLSVLISEIDLNPC